MESSEAVLLVTELLRRFLWSLPLFLAAALLLFFVLGNTEPMRSRLDLPLFYNENPKSAQSEANDAMDAVLAGGAQTRRGAVRLVELGGAALPTVLDRLPSLRVKERRAIAEALWPLARRMGLSQRNFFGVKGSSEEHPMTTDEKLLFWERYGEEHALDLRPQAVQRLVGRVAETDARLREADLYAVDTYALPTLVAALGRVRTREDVERCSRLVEKINHLTDRSFRLSPDATREEATRVVTQVRRFFDEHGPQWTSSTRVETLVARVAQTEFALWVIRLTRQVIGLDSLSDLSRVAVAAQVSFPVLLTALAGLLFLGPTLAASLFVGQLKESRWRLQRLGLRTGLAATLVVLLPFLLEKRDASPLELSLVSLFMGATLSTFILQRELSNRLDWRTHHVLRNRSVLSRTWATTRWLAPSIPTMTPMAVTEAALWVTALEIASSTNGVGLLTVKAIQEGDLSVLMVVCLGLGLLTGALQILADSLLGSPLQRRGAV